MYEGGTFTSKFKLSEALILNGSHPRDFEDFGRVMNYERVLGCSCFCQGLAQFAVIRARQEISVKHFTILEYGYKFERLCGLSVSVSWSVFCLNLKSLHLYNCIERILLLLLVIL